MAAYATLIFRIIGFLLVVVGSLQVVGNLFDYFDIIDPSHWAYTMRVLFLRPLLVAVAGLGLVYFAGPLADRVTQDLRA